MHSVQTIRPWIQAALASLAWALAGHAASPIVLRDEAWTVKIDPGTLSVQATKQNGRRVTLSRPVMEAGQPVDIRVAATEAQWRLKQVKLDVFASLVSEGFRLTFRSAEPGTVTWPVLGEEPGLEACVLLRDPKSKYFLGRYAPPEAPAMFFQTVEVPEKYRALYFDPRYRLPLYQTAFHDAVITTNHWSMGTLKFSNVLQTRELLELLYGVPPLYHLNQDGFSSLLPAIKGHYDFFSPLHREIGALPMTSFEWLTPDRLVQRTVFGGQVEVIANFGRQEAIQRHDRIPPRSLVVRRPGANPLTYTPKPVSRSQAAKR